MAAIDIDSHQIGGPAAGVFFRPDRLIFNRNQIQSRVFCTNFHKLVMSVGTNTMAASASHVPSHRTAFLIMHSNGTAGLCPFFGKCDGILVIDAHDRSQVFHQNRERTAEAVCDLVLRAGADRLVCGFITEPEKRRLRAAGIDVRMGSCACGVEQLAADFEQLPRA
jgi:hypothetical protein